jgi:hypothetical protein
MVDNDNRLRTHLYCPLCRKWIDSYDGSEEAYHKSRWSVYCSLCETGYLAHNETITLELPKGSSMPYQLKERE